MISESPSIVALSPEHSELVAAFSRPKVLGFGQLMAPIMAVANYHDGAWGEASLSPYQGIVFDPAAKSLHYGQQVFDCVTMPIELAKDEIIAEYRLFERGESPILDRTEPDREPTRQPRDLLEETIWQCLVQRK